MPFNSSAVDLTKSKPQQTSKGCPTMHRGPCGRRFGNGFGGWGKNVQPSPPPASRRHPHSPSRWQLQGSGIRDAVAAENAHQNNSTCPVHLSSGRRLQLSTSERTARRHDSGRHHRASCAEMCPWACLETGVLSIVLDVHQPFVFISGPTKAGACALGLVAFGHTT